MFVVRGMTGDIIYTQEPTLSLVIDMSLICFEWVSNWAEGTPAPLSCQLGPARARTYRGPCLRECVEFLYAWLLKNSVCLITTLHNY